MPQAEDPLRYSPIMGVFLTNADVDHTAGLINLRESQKRILRQREHFFMKPSRLLEQFLLVHILE